ncbi:unnamed protein product [Aureobasidium pullulans]|nr:unnamed protein product [Aureobasidium pullulans]
MSTKAKLTLAATSLGALGIIIFVHHGQKVEKAERQLDFDMQAQLEKEYRKLQSVSDGRNQG